MHWCEQMADPKGASEHLLSLVDRHGLVEHLGNNRVYE